MTQHPIRPLSVGNVVSAGLRLYRARFQSYLGLSVKAILWALIPIYGWAKFYAISAQISRLAFSDLVNRPESVKTASNYANSQMWYLLAAQVLVGLFLFAANICISILMFIVLLLPTMIFSSGAKDNNLLGLFLAVFQLVVRLVNLIVQLWIQSRFIITELPLVIESEIDAIKTINRSWQLTQGSVVRIQLIILVGYLITLPLLAIAMTPAFLMIPFIVAAARTSQESIGILILLLVMIVIVLLALAMIVLIPFWQSIKAVIYYDLRSRKEGLDIQLRDPGVEL